MKISYSTRHLLGLTKKDADKFADCLASLDGRTISFKRDGVVVRQHHIASVPGSAAGATAACNKWNLHVLAVKGGGSEKFVWDGDDDYAPDIEDGAAWPST